MATELRDTLNLPVTDFPMRANLTAREPKRIAFWEKTGLYRRLQEKNAGTGKLFVLHDGPPFTNGDVHIGTALNKLLKDIIMRYKTMRGFRVPYVPGWDCHGLPIEHKVMKELHAKAKTLSPLEIRRACAEFSENFIEKQRAQFRRLGILADWAAEYKTKNPAYEADSLRTFANMVGKGLVYRSKKPVYWSIPCRTALAEAEIEYKNHVSTSIWVAFTQVDAPEKNFVIWTTTPWTIPANVAVAVHPDLDYVEISCGGKIYVVAEALAEKFIADCGLEGAAVVAKRRGNTLEGIRTRHPICDRVSPVVCADYIAAPGSKTTRPAFAAASKFTARSTTTASTKTTGAFPPSSSGSASSTRTENARPTKACCDSWKNPENFSRRRKSNTSIRIAGARKRPSSSAPWDNGSSRSTKTACATRR